MYHKWHLIIDGVTTEITNDVKNWDDTLVAYKRSDYDGLVRTFTTDFELVKDARLLIKNLFERDGLYSNATIVFSLRNNNWIYEEKFRALLNFSTYTDDGFTMGVDAIDSSLLRIIKAKGSTEYEFYASDLIDGSFTYDGVEVEQSGSWVIQGSQSESASGETRTMVIKDSGSRVGRLDMGYIDNESIYKNNVMPQDQTGLTNPFVGIKPNKSLSLTIKFKVQHDSASNMIFGIGGSTEKTNFFPLSKEFTTWYTDINMSSAGYGGWIDVETVIPLYGATNGSEATTYFWFYVQNEDTKEVVFYFKDVDIKAAWVDKGSTDYSVNFIKPTTLLNKILSTITGTEQYTGVIDTYDSRLSKTMILPAETIRGIDGAKVYTSFNKFRDWMKAVFGYVYSIDDTVLTFKHRTQYFDRSVSKAFTSSDIAGYSYSIEKGLVYSSIKAGYESQTYEVVNGRDEFRFGIVYTTDLDVTDASELSLISPYRCDAYGIEILVSKREEKTTDTNSDKSIFFVGLTTDSSGKYVLDRATTATGLISNSTQYNLMYSPRRCILSNISTIAACMETGKTLTFASSEGNSDVVIGGISEKADITITAANRKYSSGIYEFTVGDMVLPENLLGIVQFSHDGKTKNGYVYDVTYSCGKEKELTYRLIDSGIYYDINLYTSVSSIAESSDAGNGRFFVYSTDEDNAIMNVSAKTAVEWLTVKKGLDESEGSRFYVDYFYTQNTTGKERSAIIYITQGVTGKKIQVKVTQSA